MLQKLFPKNEMIGHRKVKKKLQLIHVVRDLFAEYIKSSSNLKKKNLSFEIDKGSE